MISFTVPGEPKPKGRPRFTKYGHIYTPEKTKIYEQQIRAAFIDTDAECIGNKEPVKISIKAYFKIPKNDSKRKRDDKNSGIIRPVKRPDTDNIVKSVLDGLNKFAYEDDSQVVEVSASKYYSDNPRTEVIISRL